MEDAEPIRSVTCSREERHVRQLCAQSAHCERARGPTPRPPTRGVGAVGASHPLVTTRLQRANAAVSHRTGPSAQHPRPRKIL